MISLKGYKRSHDLPAELRRRHNPGSDRRKNPRIPTFSFVEICDEYGEILIDATIREISAYGAQLRLKSASKLPGRLIIRSQPDRVCSPATLKWMSGVSIGIEFDAEVRIPKAQQDKNEGVRIVESHLFGREDD